MHPWYNMDDYLIVLISYLDDGQHSYNAISVLVSNQQRLYPTPP
jgi:hypothetical protein